MSNFAFLQTEWPLVFEAAHRDEAKTRLIKDLGNQAVHSTKNVAATDALSATRESFHFG